MKGSFRDISVKQGCSLVDALKIMEKSSYGIVFVLDEDDKLTGILTDIDLRISLLNGKKMDLCIEHYMNKNPITISAKASKEEVLELKQKYKTKRILPVLDENGRIVGVETTGFMVKLYSNPVVILAGGLGKRLMPLTTNTPKPMLNINERPLLEHMIKALKIHGFNNIFISVNYHGEKIKKHFGDGKAFNVNIEYIEEPSKLGTAGSLSLLPEIKSPVLVINGDILTNVDFSCLIDFHLNSDNAFTAALFKYELQVPYGVAKIEGERLRSIEEKPIKDFFVLAGINVLNPDIVKIIPKERIYDMTSLIEELINKNIPIGCFPIREYWIDVGREVEYKKANEEFNLYFNRL